MRRRLGVLTVVAALGCLAFTVIRDPDTLEPIRWPAVQIAFVIQQDGSDDIADGSDIAAIRAAFVAWSQVVCSNFVVQEAGIDASRAIGQDGVSRITFIESGWPGGANGAGAFTTRHRDTGPDPDAWIESDIRLNGEQFSWATDGHQERLDLQSIITHEIGHSIGLQHSADPASTMYFTVSPGTTAGRTLGPDDIAGLCFVYPEGGQFQCSDDRDCPLYFGQLGGADRRTRCEGGACVPGAVGYGLDCFGAGDCTSGLCVRDPVGPPPSEPGACSQSCSAAACPAGSLCSDFSGADRCHLGRDDCADDDDCPGGNSRCIHDLDGRWRCVNLCLENRHCGAFPGAVCHGGNGVSGRAWCRVPGPGGAGATCDHGYECASLACTEGGANPICAPGVPDFEGDAGARDGGRDAGGPGRDGGVRDAGVRDGGAGSPPRDGGARDSGSAELGDTGTLTPTAGDDLEGGCTCTAKPRAHRRGGALGALIVGLSLAALRRRRRGARRRGETTASPFAADGKIARLLRSIQ